MRYIAISAALAVLLLELSDVIPKSSVGGPMTMMFAFLIAMLVLGLYEAWSNGRGVLGWIMSIVASVVGGLAAALVGGMVMDIVLTQLSLSEPLATSHHPLRYIAPVGMMLLTLSGSWIALQILNRFR